MINQIDIDLSKPGEKRWELSNELIQQGLQLVKCYTREQAEFGKLPELFRPYATVFLTKDHRDELYSLAEQLNCSKAEILGANFHYDVLKYVLGCSAFGICRPEGPLHGRNLDWWTENDILTKYTLVTNYHNGPAGLFRTVGWPGFAGILSATAPGRFSVTLNAVTSPDKPIIAQPVVYLLRRVFETEKTFDAAVRRLSKANSASDCILLVTGVKPDEAVVIERTPKRSAVREAKGNFVIATNDYLLLDNKQFDPDNLLLSTSCSRFQTVRQHLEKKLPDNPQDCFSVLQDPEVQMEITVQQMVFSAASDTLEIKLPGIST